MSRTIFAEPSAHPAQPVSEGMDARGETLNPDAPKRPPAPGKRLYALFPSSPYSPQLVESVKSVVGPANLLPWWSEFRKHHISWTVEASDEEVDRLIQLRGVEELFRIELPEVRDKIAKVYDERHGKAPMPAPEGAVSEAMSAERDASEATSADGDRERPLSLYEYNFTVYPKDDTDVAGAERIADELHAIRASNTRRPKVSRDGAKVEYIPATLNEEQLEAARRIEGVEAVELGALWRFDYTENPYRFRQWYLDYVEERSGQGLMLEF